MAMLAILVAAALGATAAGSRVDRSFLFSPPEAAAEGFLRELQTRRYEQARSYLSAELRGRYGEDDLESWFGRVEQEIGEITEVEGSGSEFEREVATGTVKLETKRSGELPMTFAFVREQKEWRIAELSEPSPR
jgi:hypothetical protein